LGNKSPDLPANLFTSSSTLARSTLRHEWVDIPLGNVKLHTWIEYPLGEDKAAVVIVMHYDAGLDDLQRAVAAHLQQTPAPSPNCSYVNGNSRALKATSFPFTSLHGP
jgi:hypothetical protein